MWNLRYRIPLHPTQIGTASVSTVMVRIVSDACAAVCVFSAVARQRQHMDGNRIVVAVVWVMEVMGSDGRTDNAGTSVYRSVTMPFCTAIRAASVRSLTPSLS